MGRECLDTGPADSVSTCVGDQRRHKMIGFFDAMQPATTIVALVRKRINVSRSDERATSDAYKMNWNANIDQNGTELSGNWFESQYRQGGKVSGQNANGVIEARVEGQTITALLTVNTKGNRQTFVMDSPGAWVSHVSIELVRDAR